MGRRAASGLRPTARSIDRYELIEVFESGSFGIVYRAYDFETRRELALKVARPEVLIDRDQRKRFENEAVLSARLNHPLIVCVFDANLDSPTPYIASRFVSEPNLSQWLMKTDDTVDSSCAVAFLVQLADAVQYAHEQGVLHRDLKPANVLLDVESPDDQNRNAFELPLNAFGPRITDFSLAKLIED